MTFLNLLIFLGIIIFQQTVSDNVDINTFFKEINTTNSSNKVYSVEENIVNRFYLNKNKEFLVKFLQDFKHFSKFVNEMRMNKQRELASQNSTVSSPFHGCSNASYPGNSSGEIPTFKVILDNKPEERWKEIVKEKITEIKKLAEFFDHKFGPKFMKLIDKYLTWIHHTLPEEYYKELQGIAEAAGINIGRVTLYNVFYEFFSLCTSIVLEGEGGNMYHGRNLDFGLFMGWDAKNHTWFLSELLRPLIVKVDFVKNGKPLYSAVTYAGYTGVLTGLKKGLFSLTIDERFVLDGGYVGIMEWVLGLRNSSWLGLLTRQVLETAQSYKEAVEMLSTTQLVAPVYFILAGNQSQGCILTRGRKNSDKWDLGSKHSNQSENWYLVETNYDHWQQPPWYDQRRRYAVQCMDELGRRNPLDSLYKVLSTRPVFNKETTLTALMDVAAGTLLVWERECEDPCWPFA